MWRLLNETMLLFKALWVTFWGGADVPVLDYKRTSEDMSIALIMALVLFVCNLGIRYLIVLPSVKSFLQMPQQRAEKCTQSIMEFAMYGIFTILGCRVVLEQTWVWPSAKWWPCDEVRRQTLDKAGERADLKCFYLLYLGRYIQMYINVLIEPRRKDFVQMLVHHGVTVILVYVSYTEIRFNRIGTVMMLLMDPADILLHLAKVFRYIAGCRSTTNKIWQHLCDCTFIAFSPIFFLTRIVGLSYVLWSILTDIDSDCFYRFCGIGGLICIVFLFTLCILQLYWFSLLVKALAQRLLFKEGITDARSDDEDAGPQKANGEKKNGKTNHGSDKAEYPKKNGKTNNGKSNSGQAMLSNHTNDVIVWAPVFVMLLCWLWGLVPGQTPSVEAVMEELHVLLSGLLIACMGPSDAVAKIPLADPNYPVDTVIAGIFFFAFFFFNWGVRLIMIEPLIRQSGYMRRAMRVKFAQSIMEMVFYGGFAIVGLRVLCMQVWVWPSANWWLGYAEGRHIFMRADFRCFYMMYISRYAQGLVSVLLEPKRKDLAQMLIHHGATVVLIALSYVSGWNRVGLVVMVLMDPGDVPLHTAKLCKYMHAVTNKKIWEFLANRLFEFFGVIFFLTRLVAHGYVCWSAHIEATRYFKKTPAAWACVALLELLLALQIYWFSLIIQVAIRRAKGGQTTDIRSDSSDSEEANPLKKHQ